MNRNSILEKDVRFLPLGKTSLEIYRQLGTRAYTQHYTHLWKNSDPSPYLQANFTQELLLSELRDPNNAHYLILTKNKPSGILKFLKHSAVADYTAEEAIFLEKLYLLREVAGQGIGGKALKFVEAQGRKFGKCRLWLDAMQNGPALGFYQKHGYSILSEKKLHYPEVLEAQAAMFVLSKSLILEDGHGSAASRPADR